MKNSEEFELALKNCLILSSNDCKKKIISEWEKDIFPKNKEVEICLKHIYNQCHEDEQYK